MGLLATYVIYRIGRSRGRKAEQGRAADQEPDTRNPDCINYNNFCRSYGSCDEMECEY